MTPTQFKASCDFLMSDFGEPSGPPPMHPNKIQAAYVQMRNDGQFYIPQLGGSPLSIMDWRTKELARWDTHQKLMGLDR